MSQPLHRLVGEKDAVLLADPDNRLMVNIHADMPLVPASTLKLLTALVACHYLTGEYRFQTDFYVREDGSLVIKGHGDPLLVSEEVQNIAGVLRKHMNTVHQIVLDDTYFEKPLVIPGTAQHSLQPYDAPCGALCVNFNSVGFLVQDGRITSPEPQTPMVDAARARILSVVSGSGMSSGRVPLSSENNEISMYAGQVFAYFLKEAGIRVTGHLQVGKTDPARDLLVYRHVSSVDLTEIIRRLMKSSSNFMANQLLLAAGAAAFGPPATVEKGVLAAKTYASEVLGIKTLTMAEGSGISRSNRLSAIQFLKILQKFKPDFTLLRHQDREYYKTGTLNGIRARVGYLEGKNGRLYPFVVLLNTPGKDTNPVMSRLKRMIPL